MDIGPVDDVSHVSRTATTRETLLQTFEILLTDQKYLQSLQLVITHSCPENAPQKFKSALAEHQISSRIVQARESRIPIMGPQHGSMGRRDPRVSI